MRPALLCYLSQGTVERENCRPMLLMSTDEKIPSEMLANGIQQHSNSIMNMIRCNWLPECKNSLIYANVIGHMNRTEDRYHKTVSKDTQIATEKIQCTSTMFSVN